MSLDNAYPIGSKVVHVPTGRVYEVSAGRLMQATPRVVRYRAESADGGIATFLEDDADFEPTDSEVAP